MKIAACSSITSARLARLTSIPINSRSTAAVESRSSHSPIARLVSSAGLRANARVDCARGPSLPSMLMGKPSTKPTALRSPASASTRAASTLKALRWMVSTPVASRRSGLDTATPIVLVPRSSPISAPRSGQCAAASISGRMGAGMAQRITRGAPCTQSQKRRSLPDRDRVDHALHAAAEAGLAEHKQKLIRLVLGQFGGVHVFENVGPIHRQQDLVHLEHVLGFERDCLDCPVVSADGNDALAGEVLCALDAKAG